MWIVSSSHPTLRSQPGFHPLVWPLWMLAALASVSGHPLHNGVVLGTLTVVVAACGRGDATRSWRLFVQLGAAVFVARLALGGIAIGGVGYGTTPLWTLPLLRLPRWLGGLTLGGPATVEMLAYSVWGGVRVWVLILVFGAFNVLADHGGLLRYTPRWLFGAGLVVTIALAWLPQTLLQLAAIREAQRIRGGRATGVRALLPLAVSLLLGGLERALLLAEAMDSRGYGRATTPLRGGWWQAGLVGGATVLALSLFVAFGYAQYAAAASVAALGALAVLALAVRTLQRSVRVTRYHRQRWRGRDTAVSLAAAVVFLALLALRIGNPAALNPPLLAAVPPFSPVIGGVILLLAVPALIQSRTKQG